MESDNKAKVLLTGFTPFGNNADNPSWEAVKLAKPLDGMELHRLELPMVFGKSAHMLEEAIETIQPFSCRLRGFGGGSGRRLPGVHCRKHQRCKVP